MMGSDRSDGSHNKRAIWLLWIALFAVWFGTLDYRKLIRPDEGRYAEISREMVATGDWLTPRLNGFKYFEKPALQYWATATSYKVFGENEWSARLWPALTGFLSVLLAAWAGRRLWGAQAGYLAAAILASTLLYIVMSHIISLDMGLSFFLQVAWTAFLFAQQGDPKSSRHWMWLLWAALALAVLSKGLVALVLCGATLVTYSAFNRDLSPWKKLAPLSGLAIFLAIAAPWFIAVSLANPEFARFFFIHEHFARFLTKVHHRYAPDWYFIPIYLLGALPWSLLLLHALLKSWRRDVTVAFQNERFLALWVIVTFGFFSLSDSKLPPYILPIFPALALLGGKHLASLSRRAMLIHIGILAVVTAIALGLIPRMELRSDHETTAEMLHAYSRWLLVASVVSLAATLLAAILAHRRKNFLALISLAAGGTIFSFGTLLGHESLALSSSTAHIASVVRPLLSPGIPFYSVQRYEQTLPFYLKRTITVVDYKDELAFGMALEPDKWIPTTAEFKQRWLSGQDAFATMSIKTYNELTDENLPMTEITRDTRNVIVRKPH
jgi:4-amino-4-deoxy-L-arabinose transferase-like glycosyltransferase